MLRRSVVFVFAALLGASGCAGTEQDEGSSPLTGSTDQGGDQRDRDGEDGDGGGDQGDGEEPGDQGCAGVLFATFDQCLLDSGVEIGDESEEALEIIAACWIDVANGAFDECCAATPDESCDVDGPDDGGDGDDGGGGPDGTCAGVLFETNDACLAEAGSEGGDLDGSGEIDTEEEIELVSRCWIEVANGAFAECCAASPDETCDAGCGEGEHDEPRPEPVTGA